MKELPYFRFTVQEWQNGDITLQGWESQGAFINACCYYWLSDCSITKAKLEHRLNDDSGMVQYLIDEECLKHNEDTDIISICFLDEQWEMLSDMRKKRQKAGKKGGKQKSSNAKAKLKQNPSYKDKDKDKDKDKTYTKKQSNEIWDCLVSLFSLNIVTPSEKKELGQIVRDFALKEATPKRIRKVHKWWCDNWPEITCTHRGMLKNYDTIKKAIVEGKTKKECVGGLL